MTWTICVVGPCRVNNELLAAYLEAKIGTKCAVGESIDDVIGTAGQETDKPKVVLLDSFAKDPERLFLETESYCHVFGTSGLVAVFNLIRGLGIEEELLIRGTRGIFYVDDHPDQVQKGVLGLMEGKVWVSREILSRFIPETGKVRRLSGEVTSLLSEREIEILHLIAEGGNNTEIAEKLYVSRHTVKSHLYNIYRKIKVSNRLEAALWTRKNLYNQI